MKSLCFVLISGFLFYCSSQAHAVPPRGPFAKLTSKCGYVLGDTFYGFYKGGEGALSPLHVRVGENGIRITYRTGHPVFFSWDDLAPEPALADYIFNFRVINSFQHRFRFTRDLETAAPILQYEFFAEGKLRGFRTHFTREIPKMTLVERARSHFGNYVGKDFEVQLRPDGILFKRSQKKAKKIAWKDVHRAASSQFEVNGRRPPLVLAWAGADFLAVEVPVGKVKQVRLYKRGFGENKISIAVFEGPIQD